MLPEVDLRSVWNMWNFYGWNFVSWFCGIGLIFKFALLVYFLRLSPSTALLADMTMNVASMLIFAITPAPSVYPLLLTWVLGIGFDHPINWILALFLAALIAAVVESLVGLGFPPRGLQEGVSASPIRQFGVCFLGHFPPRRLCACSSTPQAGSRPRVACVEFFPSQESNPDLYSYWGSPIRCYRLWNRGKRYSVGRVWREWSFRGEAFLQHNRIKGVCE